jgi:cytochrome P450 family 135
LSQEALLPPGPKLPRAVQTAAFLIDPVRWVSACRRRYGDEAVTFSTLFDPRFVIVFEPELIKLLFRGPPDQLRAGEANELLGPILGENSVLLADGAEHLRQRKLMLPAFHGQRMRAYEGVIEEATDRVIDSWPESEPFELLPGMQALTLEVIMRAVFGVEDDDRRDDLATLLRDMLQPVANRLGILMMALSGGRRGMTRAQRRLAERRALVDEAIYAEITRRREAPDLDERDDILSMLMGARDEQGRPMTDVELRDELVTLLVAGHETTATGLAWTFELVLRNPDVRERMTDDRYVEAAVKEALRARPVISGIGRKVRGEPFQLGRWTVPPGIEINPSIAGVHRRADRYPSPESFRPERFLGDDAPDGFTWIPFGGGTRRCLGASFALFEMRTVVRRVLDRTSLEPVGRPDVGVRRGITFVPRNGVRVRQTSERLRSRKVASMPITSSAASPR